MTNNVPSITLNIGELLNTEKLSEDTTKLFRSFMGVEDPKEFTGEETTGGNSDPLTAQAEILDPYAESFRILKKAENAVSVDETDRLLRIADRYLGLL